MASRTRYCRTAHWQTSSLRSNSVGVQYNYYESITRREYTYSLIFSSIDRHFKFVYSSGILAFTFSHAACTFAHLQMFFLVLTVAKVEYVFVAYVLLLYTTIFIALYVPRILQGGLCRWDEKGLHNDMNIVVIGEGDTTKYSVYWT